MLCGGASLAVATAPRVTASASTSGGGGTHDGSGAGGAGKNTISSSHHHHRVSSSVGSACSSSSKAVKKRKPLRWVAAPSLGLGGGGCNRADTRLSVLYEPSRADASSDEREEDLVVFVAREQERARRAASSSGGGGGGCGGGGAAATVPSGGSVKKSMMMDSFNKKNGGTGGGVGSVSPAVAASKAKAAMSAMRQAEAHADRQRWRGEEFSAERATISSGVSDSDADSALGEDRSDAAVGATNRRRLQHDDDDETAAAAAAAAAAAVAAAETAMETPRRPRPTTRRAAADALAKVNLGKNAGDGDDADAATAAAAATKTKTTKTTTKKQQRGLNSSVKSTAALKAKPVDAAAAAAVLGPPSPSKTPPKKKASGVKKVKAAATTATATTATKKTSSSSSSSTSSSSTSSSSSSSVHAHVPAPTGSGAHKDDWNSFVDWKMMEHQDYQTIPDDQFETLSTKLHIKEKWRPMVSYLVSLGLTTKELEKVLVNCEELFKRPVAKILTRVEYLQNELGFEGADLRKLINKEPKILLQRNRHSIPRCRYLTEVGVPPKNLCTMLRKQPQILHLSVEKGLKPRVAYFKNELLIAEDEIPKLIERNPAVLTFSVENQIKPRVEFLKDLGISHEGVSKMIVRHPHLLQYSFEGLEEHINFLSSIGMNEEQMVLTVTRLSQLFSLSVSNSLKPKFEYLTEELGGTLETCVKFPAYFSLSLDQRIRPRHTYLQRFSCAPDPFPMKYLSESDTAFAARASQSLEDFVEYKEHVVPLFKQETEKQKLQAAERATLEQQQFKLREARVEQQRRMVVKNQGYSQRIIDARNSMNRVKMLGVSRKSR